MKKVIGSLADDRMPLANSPHRRVGQKDVEFVSLFTVTINQACQRLILFFGWQTEFKVITIARRTVPRRQTDNPQS